MSETNGTTIRSYESHIQEYVGGTPQEVTGDIKNWIDSTLDGLDTDSKIIEVGSTF